MPVTILIVEKQGTIKEQVLKTFDESELYKKAGLKTPDGFKCHAQWKIDEVNNVPYSIHVYGKTTGRANQENKYEFPPPIDNTLFFGSCIIVNKQNDKACDLSESEWESIYEFLYGGFEEIGEDDSETESESDDDVPRTKSGYVKDDFVVDDDEVEEDEEDEEEEEEEDDEEEEVYVKKSKKASKAKKTAKPKAATEPKRGKGKKKAETELENVFIKATNAEELYLDCASELTEEAYV